MCSKNWIRDHVHEMKGFCHWDYDIRSFLDFIIDTQREDGCYYEPIRLSLSNTYDINRGVTNLEQSRSIIEEYMARRDTTSAFAEWFSIDPPYDKYYIYKPSNYVDFAISASGTADIEVLF